ncbi:hypothetical protein PGUG_04440 [Meyerozyma guilliermondii ATCC 6260]|uniref:Uncharacterized protein n=1 Tax=Meyerozyma guilliermondii (strain ATCC 6260 / CBS 566 / DSM 6381 / JCM 1539 / NBRC 10279 / NRRL Y-324) TaxID=294746 RepID=A5DMD9_PICGU|nr:uncharacterized protein PGUG_04440 [Meyerozyma guilliermondii ATCC 6260]EDK40342.2 hypothetical protein PGUG_04440 [Meyerozyma guilliermondii ATCC 6260]
MGFKFLWSSKRASYASSDESSVFDSAPTTLSIPTITEEDLNKTSKPTSCYTTRPLSEETLCLEKVEDKTEQYSQHKRQQYSKDPPQPSKSSQQKASQNQPQPSQRSPQNSSSSSRLERRKSFGLLLAQKVSRLSGSHLKESRPKSTLFESSPTSNTYNTHRQSTAPKSPPRDPESPERFSSSPSTLVGSDVSPKLPYVLENQPSITHIIEPRQKTQIPTFFHARPQSSTFELPVKKDQILKIKIFVTSSSSSTSDVIALKLKKQKLQNIHELIQVIQFKVGFRLAAVETSDIKLSIFFKNPKLKPIPLSQSDSAGRSLDSNLLMDYIIAKDKLYVNACVDVN